VDLYSSQKVKNSPRDEGRAHDDRGVLSVPLQKVKHELGPRRRKEAHMAKAAECSQGELGCMGIEMAT